jgi:hypothetical protein
MQTQTENGRNYSLFCYKHSIDERPKNPKHLEFNILLEVLYYYI